MNRKILLIWVFAAVLALCGCSMLTVDQLYCLPDRSENFNNLQTAINQAMHDKEYCAPLAGENQQTVQQADLDGDGVYEYLVFARGNSEKPLAIYIFRQENGQYVLWETIESNGTAFDRVEYVQMDESSGVELVVGKQVSEQVLRSVSVYTFSGGRAETLAVTNYTWFLPCDLDGDQRSELLVLQPNSGEVPGGVAVLYGMRGGVMERSNEAIMSEPVDKLKRVLTGRLHGGKPAVFVASAVGESAIITDVYTVLDGVFTNVSLSNESGTSMQTLRNYYVYADDIDEDGEVELPDLIPMRSRTETVQSDRHYLIRWYAMDPDGTEVDKMYTFYNTVGGWYLQLAADWADRITVTQAGSAYHFYLWNKAGTDAEKMFTVYAFTGRDREDQAVSENRFMLYKDESTVYAAYLEVASATIDISVNDLIGGFRLIRHDWKTGET